MGARARGPKVEGKAGEGGGGAWVQGVQGLQGQGGWTILTGDRKLKALNHQIMLISSTNGAYLHVMPMLDLLYLWPRPKAA